MTTYITDADLKASLASAVHVDSSSLSPFWDDLVSKSNQAAYQDVVTGLMGRGFTFAQVNAWDRRVEFNEDIGIYWCLLRGGLTADYGEGWKNLDRRKELTSVFLTINGIMQNPGNQPGQPEFDFTPIGSGQQQTGNDLFGLDPTDPRLGQMESGPSGNW